MTDHNGDQDEPIVRDKRRIDPETGEVRADASGESTSVDSPDAEDDELTVEDVVGFEQAADELAAEHLSIDTRDPEATLARIRHAGAAFLGPYSPVAAGDYAAGPSHVLPTGGTARFAAGLSANEFLRGGSVIKLTAADLAELSADIATLADTEGLTAHRRSVEARHGIS